MGPYFDGGLMKLSKGGKWGTLSTRENNFSNRSNKGRIIVIEKLSGWEIFFLGVGGIVGAGAAGFGLFTLAEQGKMGQGGVSAAKKAKPMLESAGSSGKMMLGQLKGVSSSGSMQNVRSGGDRNAFPSSPRTNQVAGHHNLRNSFSKDSGGSTTLASGAMAV